MWRSALPASIAPKEPMNPLQAFQPLPLARPCCPECSAPMFIVAVEPDAPGSATPTFECPICRFSNLPPFAARHVPARLNRSSSQLVRRGGRVVAVAARFSRARRQSTCILCPGTLRTICLERYLTRCSARRSRQFLAHGFLLNSDDRLIDMLTIRAFEGKRPYPRSSGAIPTRRICAPHLTHTGLSAGLKTPDWSVAITSSLRRSATVLSATGAMPRSVMRACTATAANSQINRTDAKNGRG